MGSCVSVHKDTEKLCLSVESKDEKILIPSPVKQKSDVVNGRDLTIADVALKSSRSPSPFRNAGSKDEAFFDSQPWFDSDCEDEFLSVNGDFTPSLGSTPIHHNFSSEKPPLTKTLVVEPSQDKRKRLSELFKESLRNNTDDENAGKAEARSLVKTKARSLVKTKSTNGTSFNARTQNGDVKTEDESMKSAQCCLPRLRSSHSYSERRKKMSPAHSSG